VHECREEKEEKEEKEGGMVFHGGGLGYWVTGLLEDRGSV